MTPDQEPPIHPDVLELIADITKMADTIRQPFVTDPEKVRSFNAGYIQSLERAAARDRSLKHRPTD